MPSTSMRGSTSRRRAIGDWRASYFAAVLETDAQHAMLKILSARKAKDRLIELQTASVASPDESRDLQSALTYLEILFSYVEESAAAARLSAMA